MMVFLIGCEESPAVCKALRDLGIEAYNCDKQKCSGGHPEWHIQADVFLAIKGGKIKLESGAFVFIEKWDAAIFFPVISKTFPGIAKAMAEQWTTQPK